MKVGIHPNKKYRKFKNLSTRFINLLEYNNVEFEILYAGAPDFWDKVTKIDLFIYQWSHHDFDRQIAHTILPILQNQLKIKCFPNGISSWIYDDKIREYYLMRTHNFPFAETWVFHDRENADAFINEVAYPVVFKLKSGAGARMVRLIRDKRTAEKYINLMFRKGVKYNIGLPGTFVDDLKQKGLVGILRRNMSRMRERFIRDEDYYEEDWGIHQNYVLFQKFFPNNDFDTRVVIIGKRAFAFKRYNRMNDFRASGGNVIEMEHKNIDLRFIELAFSISFTFGFDAMSYDFLYDESKNPVIVELSYIFGSKKGTKIDECEGYWDERLNWKKESGDAGFYILSDLLPEMHLKRKI